MIRSHIISLREGADDMDGRILSMMLEPLGYGAASRQFRRRGGRISGKKAKGCVEKLCDAVGL